MGLFKMFSTDKYPGNKVPGAADDDFREPFKDRACEVMVQNAKAMQAALDKSPDPSNWQVIKSEQLGEYLVVMLQYPNCKNYEGKKIMVYRGITLEQLMAQKLIDPHFSDNPKYASPVARFAPTDEGWKMAEVLCRELQFLNDVSSTGLNHE